MTALPPDVAADLSRENARLQAELRAARDRQNASADILRTIAGASGEAERSLYQIAETSMRLFGATSATIQIAEGDGWSQIIRVGDSSKRIGAGVPESQLRIGGRNMPGTIVAENRQVHLPDLDNIDPAIADWPGLPYARAAGTRSMSGSPLRLQGKAIGALIVYRDRLAPFSEEELVLQQSFADQAAIAIDNARLFNETKEALERQTATADILKVIAGSPSDTTPVFEAIATSANRLLGGFSSAVFRFLDDTVHLAAFAPVSSGADAALKADFPRPVDAFEPYRLARQGEPFPIPDTEEIPYPPIREIARLHGFRSMLFVPLMNGGILIGIISVTRREAGAFSPNHIQLLQTFADQAVIAIENTRLFNETKEALERQTATAEILKVMAGSPSDVQPVFDAIAESARRLLGGHTGLVTRVAGDMLDLAAFTAGSEAGNKEVQSSFPTPLSSFGIHSKAARTAKISFRTDIAAEPDVPQAVQDMARTRGYRSIIVVPMLREGVSIGTIGVTRREPGPFIGNHVDLLGTFADQAVIAIENVRLFNETREALERQTATAEILRVIASSPTDVQPVFDAIATSANRLLGGFSTAVFRFLDGASHLAAFTPTHPAADEVLKASFPRPLVGFQPFETANMGEPVQIADTEAAEARIRDIARARGFRSMLFSPLMSNGTSTGIISVTRLEAGAFSPNHVQLLQTFADQAVIAIENVRLFDEVQARTRDLSEALTLQTATADVLKVISRSAFDLQKVLDTLAESAARLCEADIIIIHRRVGDGFRGAASFGLPEAHQRAVMEIDHRPGRGSLGARVLLENGPVLIDDADTDPEYTFGAFQRRLGMRSMLGVPLMREGAAIGLLLIFRKRVQPFTERHVDLATTFADQAVIAIQNVRLFDEVQARTKELAASLEDLRTAQDRLIQTEKLASLGQLTAGIAHEIKNPLNFVNNFAALSAELTDELNDVLKPVAFDGKVRGEVDELTGMLKDNLEKVVHHGKRADSIVKNMLLHSREGSGEHRPADINALLDESLNLAYHGARAERPAFNVTLQRDFDAAAGAVEVFPQEITRVFLNLIANGFYAVAKRKVEQADTGFDPILRASTKSLGDTVEIRIRDNGTGIPSHVKDKMFNPFFTTKPAGEGTGLGLSMSHDIIVKQHGGTIDVETAPGQFTEFIVLLPRTSNPSNKNGGQT
jgi:two-component system, NtrC family, sensor kinase